MTTTSGLAWKIPGRLGDSPILGAGLYVDGEVGAAGSTGRGEANLYNLSSYPDRRGDAPRRHPKDAGMTAFKRIKANTIDKRLLNDRGLPNFGDHLLHHQQEGRVRRRRDVQRDRQRDVRGLRRKGPAARAPRAAARGWAYVIDLSTRRARSARRLRRTRRRLLKGNDDAASDGDRARRQCLSGDRCWRWWRSPRRIGRAGRPRRCIASAAGSVTAPPCFRASPMRR